MKEVEGIENYDHKDYNYITLDYEFVEAIPEDGYFLHYIKEEDDSKVTLTFAPLVENIEDLVVNAAAKKWPEKNIELKYGNIPLGFSNIQHFLKKAGLL